MKQFLIGMKDGKPVAVSETDDVQKATEAGKRAVDEGRYDGVFIAYPHIKVGGVMAPQARVIP